MTIKKDPVSWDITDGTLGTSGEYITSMEVSSMKTMSITKIALALLVSIPALSLNGAAVATTVAPSLWKSFCSRTQALTSRAMSGIKSGAKAGFVKAQNFIANHKVASKYSAIAAATSLAAFGAYKGYKWGYKWYQARQLSKQEFADFKQTKDKQEALEAMLAKKDRLEAKEAEQAKLENIQVKALEKQQAEDAQVALEAQRAADRKRLRGY